MEISKIRERIKNTLLYYEGTKFNWEDTTDIGIAEKIAGNCVIMLADWLKAIREEEVLSAVPKTDEDIKKAINDKEALLRADSTYWQPNPEIVEPK